MQYGHSFTDYWGRFASSKPEFFAMLPDHTRRLDPKGSLDGHQVAMCVSEPEIWNQKIKDWETAGTPEYLNLCENDTPGSCVCSNCMAWDVEDPQRTIPFAERFDRAGRAWGEAKGKWSYWMVKSLGSLSDRYAKFVSVIYDLARKKRPDVKVVFYSYENYSEPPLKTRLNDNVYIGICPYFMYPYTRYESAAFRKVWNGWAAAGCRLFLRPNYTISNHDFPVFYARQLAEDLKFAWAHRMVAADFDSLTGQWAVQGPTLYVLAVMMNHPDRSVESVLREYYEAFGPAEGLIRDYFAHWEKVSNAVEGPQMDRIRAEKKKYGSGWGTYYVVAPAVFSQQSMDNGFALLECQRSNQTDPPRVTSN